MTDDVLRLAAQRATAYLDGIDARPVRPDPDAVARLGELGGPFPDGPTAPERVIAMLDEVAGPATMAMGSPRFFGFVIGGALPVTTAANWLATAWDQNTGFYHSTPSTAMLEQHALAWILDALGLPPGCAGGYVTGATVANFTALAAARHALYARAGWNVEADGMIGAPKITVVAGAEMHPSARKALGMLGFGRNTAVEVPVDDQGRMRADALPDVAGPMLVVTQAGNVNTGSFDPIGEICEWAHARGGWVHVDGAFGLWAAAAPERRHLVRGVERADSWATDAHKWLNVPYDSGLAIVREPDTLRAAMAMTAAYLPAESERDPASYTPELSRRARGVEVWAALKSLGRSGLADLIERCCRHATRFAEGLSAAGYRVLNDVVLNQVLVSFGDDETTRRAVAAIQEDGTCWAGITVWQGQTAMRISVSNWATTEDDVERSLAAMIRCAKQAAATPVGGEGG
ncbi:MAG TPA: pyridoxal-dependent decarboxylase [Dehalococcoidia bacterium]|nr:pyridoxal-dependent decarboxylase [Dehalococcoidia bacterium]